MTISDDIESKLNDAISCADDLANALRCVADGMSRMRMLVDFHDTGKGFRWEKEFKELARARGLVVTNATDSKHDCVVNGKRVQCKRIDKDNGLICTTPIIGRSYCGYQKDDWDVLALRQMDRLLIVPSEVMVLDDGFRLLNQIKPGQFSCWQDRWDVFGICFEYECERQQVLFGINKEATDGTHP